MKFLMILLLCAGLNLTEEGTHLEITETQFTCPGEANGSFEIAIHYGNDFVFPGELTISDGERAFENGYLPAGEYCLSLSDGRGEIVAELCRTIREGEDKKCSGYK